MKNPIAEAFKKLGYRVRSVSQEMRQNPFIEQKAEAKRSRKLAKCAKDSNARMIGQEQSLINLRLRQAQADRDAGRNAARR